MTRKTYWIYLILCIFSFISCSNSTDDSLENNTEIILGETSVSLSAGGGSTSVKVTCTNGEWGAFTSDSWIKVKANNSTSKEGTVDITVLPNTETTSRNGVVTVKSGTLRSEILVAQSAFIGVAQSVVYMSSAGECVYVDVKGSGDWTASTEEAWLKVEKVSSTSGAENCLYALKISSAENEGKNTRTGKVYAEYDSQKLEISVIQEGIEDRDIVTPAGYHLVWHDEFNEGTTLSNDWTHEVQKSGWVNNELQNYVNGQADGKRVTEIKDGRLNIHCFKGSDGKVYSGRVYAKVNTGWLYGYFEARIKLPSGKGTWPAWWMMPVNNDWSKNPWPNCGEIDIMEEVGYHADFVSSSVHTELYNHSIGTQRTHEFYLANAEGDYHTYACEWTPDYLAFIFDGKEHYRVKNDGTGKGSWPFTYAFYPILNLAWGGAWGGAQGVDDKVLPVTMQVDYVRIFQK